MNIITKLMGDPNERELKKIRPIVARINDLEPEMEALSDEELRDKTAEFRQAIEDVQEKAEDEEERRKRTAEVLDDLLPEAFAVVREASRRTIGMRHYDVQMIGGIVLHQGKIAEMGTGEGKTLVATLPSYLNALPGEGVHIVTVNDYLAKRDREWMGRIHEFLGLKVDVILTTQNPQGPERRAAYQADITYGTNNEFGFDYLRDNMAPDLAYCVQRPLNFGIVDEVDNILIDEARTPLIISGQAEESAEQYVRFAKYVPRLKEEEDYLIDLKSRTVAILDSGIEKIEHMLGIQNIYADMNLTRYLENALKAHAVFKREKDYIVKDNEVIIVDEFTGRLMVGRRYSEGLHQAIEAKEGVKVQQEMRTLATITFQNYFRLYRKLAGMTGTALTEAEEFNKIYKLDVIVIPTNRPKIREDLADLIYKTEEGKFDAVVAEIKARSMAGQPILVGTTSVELSEHLAGKLSRQGVAHNVLNAKFHEKEAHVVANAGRSGAVTIATNMAGRGTDILLGGNPAEFVNNILAEWDIDLEVATEEDRADALEEAKKRCEEDRKRVLRLEQLRACQTQEQHLQDIYTERKIDPAKATTEQKQKAEADAKKRFARYMRQWENAVLEEKGIDPQEASEEQRKSVAKDAEQRRAEQYEQELALRGLHIIGTERHEARRIDNQLRGRTGRQGDPGSSRFYLSLQDDLMRRFGTDRVSRLMDAVGMDDSMPIESGLASKFIEQAQTKIEGINFDIRKNVVEYDDVIAKQREVIYADRHQMLEHAANLRERITGMLEAEVKRQVELHTQGARPEDWDLDGLLAVLKPWFEVPDDIFPDNLNSLRRQDLTESLIDLAQQAYEAKEEKVRETFSEEGKDKGNEIMRMVERQMFLQVVDRLWMDHIDALDVLRSGIGLRAVAQRDPKVEFQREGFRMFEELKVNIQHGVVDQMMRVQISKRVEEQPKPKALARNLRTNVDQIATASGQAKSDGAGMARAPKMLPAPATNGNSKAAANGKAPAANGHKGQPAKGVPMPAQGAHPKPKQQPVSAGARGPQPPQKGAAKPQQVDMRRVGRNDPCPCGSGKKYKMCHGR
ncbi:MAG TPA: preprotein translocase subunit SecA [Ktedonobacterales bacterium]|jgi:preprotein translocase subunit SecA